MAIDKPSMEVFEYYARDSRECRDALASIYVSFEAIRSTPDPLERGIQFKNIKDSLASVGYE